MLNRIIDACKENYQSLSDFTPADIQDRLPRTLTAGPVFLVVGAIMGVVAQTSALGTGILLGATMGVWLLEQEGLYLLAVQKVIPLKAAFVLSSCCLALTFSALIITGLALAILSPPVIYTALPLVLLSTLVPIALAFIPELDNIAASS